MIFVADNSCLSRRTRITAALSTKSELVFGLAMRLSFREVTSLDLDSLIRSRVRANEGVFVIPMLYVVGDY